MSEDFKRKLEAYEKDELNKEELAAFEKELEKLESYQEIMEKEMGDPAQPTVNDKKQKRILKKGKWKARLQTAFTVLGLFIMFTIISSILTAVYYSWGNPDRVDVFRNVIDYTLTVTDPYGYLGATSTNSTTYFGLEATRDIRKSVGNETIKIGDLEVNFLFSLMTVPEKTSMGAETQSSPVFVYPGNEAENTSEWEKLENYPEGTVVSAYISFDELLETKEVEQLFSDKDMNLLWLAVDTGVEATDDRYHGIIIDPVGFPSHPIWHDDDMILQSREEETGLFGSGTTSESYQSPAYSEGDQEILHEQFMKTLYFLSDHERKVNQLVFSGFEFQERINYLENNGIYHYGAVITGPTKEILDLQEESWARGIAVDEVAFWNWD